MHVDPLITDEPVSRFNDEFREHLHGVVDSGASPYTPNDAALRDGQDDETRYGQPRKRVQADDIEVFQCCSWYANQHALYSHMYACECR